MTTQLSTTTNNAIMTEAHDMWVFENGWTITHEGQIIASYERGYLRYTLGWHLVAEWINSAWLEWSVCPACAADWALGYDPFVGTCDHCGRKDSGYCPTCGSPDYDGRICSRCGEGLPLMECSVCGHITDFEVGSGAWALCRDCGERRMLCTFCGDWYTYADVYRAGTIASAHVCPSCACDTVDWVVEETEAGEDALAWWEAVEDRGDPDTANRERREEWWREATATRNLVAAGFGTPANVWHMLHIGVDAPQWARERRKLLLACVERPVDRVWDGLGEASVKNYTGHDLDIRRFGAPPIVVPAEGCVRLTRDVIAAGVVADGTPLEIVEFSAGDDLPPQREGVLYCVSALVANAYPSRHDLVTPRTDRDADNRVYCTGYTRVVT